MLNFLRSLLTPSPDPNPLPYLKMTASLSASPTAKIPATPVPSTDCYVTGLTGSLPPRSSPRSPYARQLRLKVVWQEL